MKPSLGKDGAWWLKQSFVQHWKLGSASHIEFTGLWQDNLVPFPKALLLKGWVSFLQSATTLPIPDWACNSSSVMRIAVLALSVGLGAASYVCLGAMCHTQAIHGKGGLEYCLDGLEWRWCNSRPFSILADWETAAVINDSYVYRGWPFLHPPFSLAFEGNQGSSKDQRFLYPVNGCHHQQVLQIRASLTWRCTGIPWGSW